MLYHPAPAPPDTKIQTEVRCRHYWIIEPANGPVSRGVCQHCQETRQFQNFILEDEKEY